jgi:geranylgeranyl pyrophosphate synthase
LLEESGEGHDQAREAAKALRRALDSTNSLDYARATAKRLVSEAKSELADLPESAAKQGLLQAADAVVERNL